MNGRMLRFLRSPSDLAVPWMLAAALGIFSIPALVGGAGLEQIDAEERPLAQVRFDKWRNDLLPGVSLVVAGGGLINNGFPALSADRSQIAILYYAGHPMHMGYPTFEFYSTSNLALLERIELFPEHQQLMGENPDLWDDQLLMQIEFRLDEINYRLNRGRFRPMATLFKMDYQRSTLDITEKFGKRIAYPSDDTVPATLTITCRSTGKVELETAMPGGVEDYGSGGQCGWGGNPEEAWYDPQLRIMVLQMTFSTSIHGCEQPERWLLKRLGSPRGPECKAAAEGDRRGPP